MQGVLSLLVSTHILVVVQIMKLLQLCKDLRTRVRDNGI
jgi:hypothetical protein